jgi:hypothetical protein
LLQLAPALQNTDPSNISPRRDHQTNKHLDTVAQRSVIEMGYSDDQVGMINLIINILKTIFGALAMD